MVGVVETRVVVVGCGAGGAAVAGELSRRGVPVLVAEAGPQQTEAFGRHIRNRDTPELGPALYSMAVGLVGNRQIWLCHGRSGV